MDFRKVNIGLCWTVTVRTKPAHSGGASCEGGDLHTPTPPPPQVRLRPPAAVNLHRRVKVDVLAARDGLINRSGFGSWRDPLVLV